MSSPGVTELARPASLAQIGGFRPQDDPLASWIGQVNVARPGEGWPTTDDEPMLALVQVAVHELPVVPEPLRDIALLTLFIGPRELPIDEPNGVRWCLRPYETLDGLEVLHEPEPARAGDPKARKGEPARYRPFPLRWREILDWPTQDSLPIEVWDDWDTAGTEDCHDGLKVGGWPLTVQGEVEWHEAGRRLGDVEFVFQVDSDEKTGFEVGQDGVLYIGRRPGPDTWHCAWQSL